MYTGRCGNTSRQEPYAQGSRKETETLESMYSDKIYAEYEMYDYTGSNYSPWNGNKRFKEKFGSHTRNTFNRVSTSYITRKVLQFET
jgi:hypothetical protein